MLALEMGRRRHISGKQVSMYLEEISQIPKKIERILADSELIKQVAASDDFASLKSQIVSAVTPSAPVVNIPFAVLGIVADLLKANVDDPLLKTVGSVNRGLGYQLKGKPLTKVESEYAAMHFGVSLW